MKARGEAAPGGGGYTRSAGCITTRGQTAALGAKYRKKGVEVGSSRLDVHSARGCVALLVAALFCADEFVHAASALLKLARIELRVLVPEEVAGRARVELEDVDAVGRAVERGVAREDDQVLVDAAGREVLVAKVQQAVLFLQVHETSYGRVMSVCILMTRRLVDSPAVWLRCDRVRVALADTAPCAELQQSLRHPCSAL